MSQVYCIRRRRKGKHLEYVDRQELEHLVTQNIKASKKNKKTQQELAVLLGVSPSTMSRELKRGLIVLRDSEWREYESYSADVAQDDYDKKATHKGPGLKIGNDHALAKHIEDKILKEKYSPDVSYKKESERPYTIVTPIVHGNEAVMNKEMGTYEDSSRRVVQ